MRRVLIFLLFASLLLSAEPNSTHAQPEPPKLPADLLYMSEWNTFTRIDAETLEATDLYTDNSVRATDMSPVSWSPSGQYLAFIKFDGEVCILTRAGILKRCFEDKFTNWGGHMGYSAYMITWAADEQSVYFLVDHGDLRSLVEADINTGQIRRTLYQINSQGEFYSPKIYWTRSLDTLFIDTKAVDDGFYYAHYPYSPDQVRGATLVHLPDNKTLTMPTELPELGKLSFCFHFSPLDHYLVARAFIDVEPRFENDDALPSFVVFDLQGNIVYTIERSRLQAFELFWADCPSWRPDEQAFYFLAGIDHDSGTEDEAYILKYSLSDDSLTQYAQVLPRVYPTEKFGGAMFLPLVVSPDGDHIAYELEGLPGYSVDEIAVVFPTSEAVLLGEEGMTDGMYPIWVPPLQTNQQSN